MSNEVTNWNPRTSYTWSKAQIQQWFDTFGSFGLHDGGMWELKSRSLGAGRFAVVFQRM